MTTMILHAFLKGDDHSTEIGRFDDTTITFGKTGLVFTGTGCVTDQKHRVMLEEQMLLDHSEFLEISFEEPRMLLEGRFKVTKVEMLDSISFVFAIETQPGLEIF